jgi:hypothetical protein
MTESTVSAPPVEKASFFEDLVDIFFAPAAVFRRREKDSFWPALLTVTVLLAVFTFANGNVLQPIMDAEWAKQTALAVKRGGPDAAAAMDKARPFTEMAQKFGAVVFVPIFVLILAFFSWLIGKLFGSKQVFHAALVVVSYTFMVRVVESVVNGIQGLVMDPGSLTGLSRIAIGPARFMDPTTTNPLVMALLTRLDLFTLWVTVLLAVGVCVTGKISRGSAVAFGITMWVLGSLPALRAAYVAM